MQMIFDRRIDTRSLGFEVIQTIGPLTAAIHCYGCYRLRRTVDRILKVDRHVRPITHRHDETIVSGVSLARAKTQRGWLWRRNTHRDGSVDIHERRRMVDVVADSREDVISSGGRAIGLDIGPTVYIQCGPVVGRIRPCAIERIPSV